jgi:hypothetical protein
MTNKELHSLALNKGEEEIRAVLNSSKGTSYLPFIIEGLAHANKTALLFELLANTPYIPKALKAAAQSGHKELVTQLLEQLSIDIKAPPSSIQAQIAFGYLLEGYSEGRHFLEAIELIEHGINPMFCLHALAFNGELDLADANNLLSQTKKSEIQDKLKNLMVAQFDLKAEQLNA